MRAEHVVAPLYVRRGAKARAAVREAARGPDWNQHFFLGGEGDLLADDGYEVD